MLGNVITESGIKACSIGDWFNQYDQLLFGVGDEAPMETNLTQHLYKELGEKPWKSATTDYHLKKTYDFNSDFEDLLRRVSGELGQCLQTFDKPAKGLEISC